MGSNLQCLLVIASLVASVDSLACSPKRETPEQHHKELMAAFNRAQSVVVVRTLAVRQHRQGSLPLDRRAIEEGYLIVEEVLKGPLTVGETIHSRTRVDDGPCSRSLLNSPASVFLLDEARPQESRPVKFSGRWLLFLGYDYQTHLVGGMDAPIELEGAGDIEAIKTELDSR